MKDLAQAILNERAVLGGIAISILQALVAGEITKATAVPVIGGIILRAFVKPSDVKRDGLI